jgi:hypothetical protein
MATPETQLSLEHLRIQSIASLLNKDERAFRLALQARILSEGGPVTVDDVIPFLEPQMDRAKAQEVLQSLIRKQVVVEGDGSVAFAYPVSAWPTAHEVSLADGRRLYAMCAVDALGCAFHFQQDISIISKCHACGEAVRIRVEQNAVSSAEPQETRVLHVALNRRSNWAESS